MGYITCITCSSAEFDIIESNIQNHLKTAIPRYSGTSYCMKNIELSGSYMIPFKGDWIDTIKTGLSSEELNMVTEVSATDRNWFPLPPMPPTSSL